MTAFPSKCRVNVCRIEVNRLGIPVLTPKRLRLFLGEVEVPLSRGEMRSDFTGKLDGIVLVMAVFH